MLTRQSRLPASRRTALLAMVAAFAVTAIAPAPVMAGTPGSAPAVVTTAGTGNATDFSAARRRYARRGGGNAAGLAAFAGVVGTIGAIAASRSRDDGYYGGGPRYYGGGPGYYDGGYGGPGYGGFGYGYGDNSRRGYR